MTRTAHAQTTALAAAAGPPPGDAPVLILGGGPIGLVCALMLARHGIACTLVDARPVAALQRDRRLLALSRGTRNALEPLIGVDFAPLGEIRRVHVSSRGQLGSAMLGAADFDGRPVGATVWYADLVAALDRAAQGQERIGMLRPRRALDVVQDRDSVRVALDDGSTLAGCLAIDAEGTPPPAGAPAQCALLAELDLACARGDAIERFTGEGPLALLPLPEPATGAGTNTRMSMVWCLPADIARARLALPDAQICARIGAALGARLGSPRAIGPRSLFPLHTHRRARVCENRIVRLGNAAQSLHPVAGQGFNLGIRDSACLVQCLVEARQQAAQAAARAGTADAGPDVPAALQRYQRQRRLDRTLLPALTSALPPLFATRFGPVAAARSAALLGLDVVPGLRRAFTRLLMFGVAR